MSATPGAMASLAAIQAAAKVRASLVSDLDWMTMASLSASSHGGSAQTVGFPKGVISDLNAITWPAMMRRWFTAVGAAPQLDLVGTGVLNASIKDFLDLLALWVSCWIVLEIDVGLLGAGGMPLPTNRHWVVVNPVQPPTIRPPGAKSKALRPAVLRDSYKGADLESSMVAMQVVSWSQDWHTFTDPTLKHIQSRFYGGYACPRFR